MIWVSSVLVVYGICASVECCRSYSRERAAAALHAEESRRFRCRSRDFVNEREHFTATLLERDREIVRLKERLAGRFRRMDECND